MKHFLAFLCFGMHSLGFAQQTNIKLMGQNRSRATLTQAPSGVNIKAVVNSQVELQSLIDASPVLLDRLSTEYVYGRMVSRHLLAIQITLVNSHTDLDLLVHALKLVNVSGPNIGPNVTPNTVQLSALSKQIVQGLAQRGQSMDPRNRWLRTLKGIGTLLTPFPTFINVGHSFIPALAALNGPGITGFETIFPDYTVDQVVRISNHAFNANQIITKNNSMNVTIFVPVDMVLSKADQKKFADDAHSIYLDFSKNWKVEVDAGFVEPASGPTAFAILSAAYASATNTLTLTGAGFLPSDQVEVKVGGEAATILSEPAVEYVDSKSLRIKLPDSYTGKVVQVKVLRADGSAKSNLYLWETK